MTIPRSTYETTEGTKPTTHGAHEPRTVKRTVTTGATTELFMMTEIGDGTFVQWTTCNRCRKQVAECTCANGPVEPDYMKKWRDDRFKRELNARPEPSYDLIPSVIEWMEERGYKVTKKREPKPSLTEEQAATLPPAEEVPVFKAPETPHEIEIEVEASDDQNVREHKEHTATKVDEGLDAALKKVRATRDLSDIPDDF